MYEEELWAPHPDYDGWYDVSTEGRIRSWKRKGPGSKRADEPKILKPLKGRGGRPKVTMYIADGTVAQPLMAHAVLETFVKGRSFGEVARHGRQNRLDGLPPDQTDNRLVNLEWGTFKQNSEDMVKDGNSLVGESNNLAKLTWTKVRKIRRLWASGNYTKQQLADSFGVTRANIYYIVTDKTWKE